VKIVISAIVSFVLGIAITYYYLGSKLQESNQGENQLRLMWDLHYLEMLERGAPENLMDFLQINVDCQASTIKQFIESGHWDENPLALQLFEKAKKYHDPKINCHDDLAKVLNQQS
jgi:hypothetical protein